MKAQPVPYYARVEEPCPRCAGIPLAEAGWHDLDPGIRETVLILRGHGVETCQSCDGTHGHSYPEPTVEFHGGPAAGWHALSVALEHDLRPAEIRRVWKMQDRNEPVGPLWQLTFDHPGGGGLQMVDHGDGTHHWERVPADEDDPRAPAGPAAGEGGKQREDLSGKPVREPPEAHSGAECPGGERARRHVPLAGGH
jgi:hypothetical protein